MCQIKKKLQIKIERCQAQIAAIYDLPETEQDAIVLEAFQSNLKNLLDEKYVLNISVHSARVVNYNGSESLLPGHNNTFKQRAFQACHCTIQQATRGTS